MTKIYGLTLIVKDTLTGDERVYTALRRNDVPLSLEIGVVAQLLKLVPGEPIEKQVAMYQPPAPRPTPPAPKPAGRRTRRRKRLKNSNYGGDANIWISSDGRQTLIEMMAPQHAGNALHFLHELAGEHGMPMDEVTAWCRKHYPAYDNLAKRAACRE